MILAVLTEMDSNLMLEVQAHSTTIQTPQVNSIQRWRRLDETNLSNLPSAPCKAYGEIRMPVGTPAEVTLLPLAAHGFAQTMRDLRNREQQLHSHVATATEQSLSR